MTGWESGQRTETVNERSVTYYVSGYPYPCSRELYDFSRHYRRMHPSCTDVEVHSEFAREEHRKMLASPRYQARQQQIAEENKRRADKLEEDRREYAREMAALNARIEQGRVAAQETLQRLWTERNAAQEKILKQRQAELDAVPDWRAREFLQKARAFDERLRNTQVVHIAYLHLVKDVALNRAISEVEALPPDTWENPIEMSAEEREARRVLGYLRA